MPIVNIKGTDQHVEFPDNMMLDEIQRIMSNKYTLPQRPQTVEPVNQSLVDKAGMWIGDKLSSTGIISDPNRAFDVGGTLASVGEFLPGIGDAAAGDEFGKALAEGDKFGMAMAGLGVIPVVGDVAKKLDMFGTSLKNKLDLNPKDSLIEYNAIPDSSGGKILNTDIARELSPDYLKDRSLSANVHEPSSAFIKKRYSEMLKEAPKPGEDAAVLFTAGGTGAGKTTGLQGIVDNSKYQIVYDTNMGKLEGSKKKIEQALDAGKRVDIAMVYRDPVESFQNGSLRRAINQAKINGTGRTVPLKEHIKTHKGSLEVSEELSKIYKDNPNVNFMAVDNSRGKGQQTAISIEGLGRFKGRDYGKVENDILKILRESYDKGEITEATFNGFK